MLAPATVTPQASAQTGAPATRRRLLAGATLTSLSVLAAACGSGGTPGGSEKPAPATAVKGAVRFSHLAQKPHPDVFTKLASQFQQQNPGVTVTAEPTWSWDNAKFIAEAVGGDTSDLVWTSENFVTPLFAKGVVREVDAYMSKDRSFKLADYYDTVIGAYKFRGKQVGMPVNFGAYVMHYNKTLFERAGRKLPDDTWTWDTFLEAAKALTRPATDGTFGQYGFETRLHENVYSSWLWNAGGDLFNPEGTKQLFDKNESIEGMQYLVDLLHRHRVAISPEVILKQTGANSPYGTNTFGLTGKIGMVFNAIYFLPTYRQAEGLQQMEWDIAPIPKGAKGRTTTNPTAGVTMWSGSKSPDAAWAFMRYLVSEEASKIYVDMQIDGLPVHKGAADLVLKDSRPPGASRSTSTLTSTPGPPSPLPTASAPRPSTTTPSAPSSWRAARYALPSWRRSPRSSPRWTKRSRPTSRSSPVSQPAVNRRYTSGAYALGHGKLNAADACQGISLRTRPGGLRYRRSRGHERIGAPPERRPGDPPVLD